MARTKCSCGGPIVSGEGYERCVVCGDTRVSCNAPVTAALRCDDTPGHYPTTAHSSSKAWRETAAADSSAREAAAAVAEMGREPFEEAP